MTENIPADLAENLIGFCESRAAVYALLSRCYEAEVDAALAEEIAERCSFETDEPELAEAFAALRGSLAARDEAALEQLAVAFNRVFFGMGPRTAQKAFPYESVYTSEGGLMMQDAYSQVLALYRAAEFAKNPAFKEPEDHLAVELAFMQRLAERAADALREGDAEAAERSLRDQLAFVRKHLLNWLPAFTRDMAVASDGGFYASLADLTMKFVQADEAALADVVE